MAGNIASLIVNSSHGETAGRLRIEPPVTLRLISFTGEGPLIVAGAARITVSKKDVSNAMKMERSDVEKWIRELVSRGHGSPLEHSSYTFEATCSRVCSHQLVRHRHASYTQHSMRWSEGFLREAVKEACKLIGEDCPPKPRGRRDYEKYSKVLEKALKLLEPEDIVYVASKAYTLPPPYTVTRLLLLKSYAEQALAATWKYYSLLAQGERRENARMLIPQAIKTRIVFTMNARELMEVFLPLRMCTRAQWEIRILAWKVWTELMKVHPELFKWTGPRCVLLENLARRDPCSLEQYIAGTCSFTVEKCPEKTPREGIRRCLLLAASSLKQG